MNAIKFLLGLYKNLEEFPLKPYFPFEYNQKKMETFGAEILYLTGTDFFHRN